jgi:C_GCAxxG_C_C family probable redox protein
MKSDEAKACFSSGYNCAQAVLLPFAMAKGVAKDEALRIASLFGGGMAKTQETCGAVTGAFMAIGLDRGFVAEKDPEGRARSLAAGREFLAAFKGEFGALTCRELLGCDLNTEEGQKRHAEEEQREKICAPCVSRAAAIVEAMLGR